MRPSSFNPTKFLVLSAALLALVILSLMIAGTKTGQAGSPFQAATPAITGTPTANLAEATPLPGAPIIVGGKVIGYVRTRLGALTPVERAALLSQRLDDLANNPFAPPVEITVAESDIGTDILANGEVLLTVTNADAAAVGLTREELAAQAAEIAKTTIDQTRLQNAPRARLMRLLESLAFLVALIVIYIIINRFYHRLVRLIDAVPTGVEQAGFIRSTNFYRSGAWKGVAKLALNLSRVVIDLLILLVLLPFVLNKFPSTAALANQLLNLVTIPLRSFWSFLTLNRVNFITIGIIALVTYILIRIEKWFFSEVAQGSIKINGFEAEWANFTGRLLSVLLVVGAMVVAFPYLPGSDSEAFRGVSLFLGALVTISSASAVTNIISGIIQTYTGAFSVGEVIRIGEVTGVVTEKKLLTTRVVTFKNEEVSIPNSSVLNQSVVNYSAMSKDKGLVLYTTITIGYDAPWKLVQDLLLAAAHETPDILKDPKPFVLQTSLNDYNISYQLNCYSKHPERMPRIYSALHASIQDQFNQAGVEIMSPAFTALRDGNTVTIPEGDRPDGYQPPGFRMNN